MGLLDGVLQFLEEKIKRIELQFKELIGILKDMDTKLEALVKLQEEGVGVNGNMQDSKS